MLGLRSSELKKLAISFKNSGPNPFGFGLSYNMFTYSNLRFSSTTFNGTINATVTITNAGKVAGKKEVELYISAPVKKWISQR